MARDPRRPLIRTATFRATLGLISGLALFAQSPDPEGPPAAGPPISDAYGPSQGTFFSRFRFHAYADVDYLRSNAARSNRFTVDELDFFTTASLTPKVTTLAEVVLDPDASTSLSSVPINVERLLLQYRPKDYFHLEAGQFRTSLGYYSTAYLRGAWFQTAISRPAMFSFEEDGGILPLHLIGVTASGVIRPEGLGLHYVVEIGNTRTWGTARPYEPVGHDAVNLAIYLRPQAIAGLELGVSDYHDRFSFLPGLEADRSDIVAHVVYTANKIEFLNEGLVASVRSPALHASGQFTGFYSQLGYRAGSNWGPYARVEKLSFHSDPLFRTPPGVGTWRSVYTAGVRYDWNDHVALKLEGGPEADWGAPHYYRAAMQIAFAF